MAITAVGSLAHASGSTKNLAVTFNATAIGDVVIVFSAKNTIQAINSITYSGVTTFQQLKAASAGCEIWWGIVTATGSATLTVKWATSTAAADIFVQQFHDSSGGTWTADTASGIATSSATAGSFPTTSPTNGGALALANWGYSTTATALSGSGTGWTFSTAVLTHLAGYDLNQTGSVSATWTASTNSTTVNLLTAFLYIVAPSVIPVPTRPVSQAVIRASNY